MNIRFKQALKQFGLGMLSFVIVLAILVGAQFGLKGRVAGDLGMAIVAAVIALAYVIGRRWIEHDRASPASRGRQLAELAVGVALGTLLFSSVIALLYAFGVYHFSAWGSAGALGTGVAFAMFSATVEEILFRGFLFRLVEIVAGSWTALLLTSALFGAAHAANPGATLSSSAAIALEAGLLLGAAYTFTGRLWLPIGLHAGWNFSEGAVYGMSVSGHEAMPSLTRGTLTGPKILTGGAFGPEASIVAVVVCLLLAILFLWRAHRSGRLRRPSWSPPLVPASSAPDSVSHDATVV